VQNYGDPPEQFDSSRSLKVIGTDTDRSATYDFLLAFLVTVGLSRTVSEIKGIAKFSHPVHLMPPLRGFLLELLIAVHGAQKLERCPYQTVKSATCIRLDTITDIGGTDGLTDGIAKTTSRSAYIAC